MRPKAKRVISMDSKIGLKKLLLVKDREIGNLKSELIYASNSKKTALNATVKATELFSMAAEENRVLKVKLQDAHEAYNRHEVDWFKEKTELEKEIVALKGVILVLKDDKKQLENRGLFERIFRVGESK